LDFICGKLPHVFDERTILFSSYMDPDFQAPTRFDFDKGRARFPFEEWYAPNWKSDVVCSQGNQLLRFGRIDQRRTIEITQRDVTNRYKRLTGTRKMGDENDGGISVLQAMRLWRKPGWMMHNQTYKISLYGEIEPNDHAQMRTAIYIFRGIHIGLMLPESIKEMERLWEYDGQNGPDWKPGSFGVLAYCKAYDPDYYEILLWGKRIIVSNEFVDRFSDECWIALEGLDYWSELVLDMAGLYMHYPAIFDVSREEEPK
jgi:hypothetical protein